ncbi:DUF1534 domain-containing protein [Pseudomonas syringae]|nr:DUF1534 domain-containing protein [Pseudomonas syringae]MCF5268585.1 DUF1534 domain-containing protein [Pseudomonas syringae]
MAAILTIVPTLQRGNACRDAPRHTSTWHRRSQNRAPCAPSEKTRNPC